MQGRGCNPSVPWNRDPHPEFGAVPCPRGSSAIPGDEEKIPELLLYSSYDFLEHSPSHRFTGLVLFQDDKS